MFKLDLHTHSIGSEDGGLTLKDYLAALKILDYIAITDHNTIRQAKVIQKSLGKNIIIGSEISTAQGELIGLFLKEDVPPGLTLEETIDRIHAQKGLSMVPHPYERWQRASVNLSEFPRLVPKLDIVETYNGRSLSLAGRFKTRRFARKHGLSGASSSDAHGPLGIGRTYTVVDSAPTSGNLKELLMRADYVNSRMRIKGYFEPSFNRRRAKIIPKEN